MQVRSCGGISANPTALLQEILPDRNVKTKEMSQKKIMGYEKGERQMRTRRLGKTGLMVSEIGFGGEWLERHPEEESIELIKYASKKGINILDCWMADPKSRNIIGEGIKENRSQWFIQGHIGSTWKDNQYFRTRDMKYVRPAFEDLLKRLQTDYIDLGMIHYVDSEEEWEKIQHSDYLDYVMELKEKGVYFAVATGRNYDAVYPMFGKAKDHIVYICNDGGSVIYRDKVISKTPLDRLVCLEVANELEKNRDYKLLFSGERNAVVTTRDIDFINYLRTMGIEPEKEKDTKSMKGEINKITIFAKKGFDQTSYEYFYKKFSKNANVAISNPEQLYLTAKYVTKGNAIQVLQHVFNSSEEDTVVFGGGYNDIEMFGHAYFSYAMQWADSEVRRSAKHIAENVNTILEDIIRM